MADTPNKNLTPPIQTKARAAYAFAAAKARAAYAAAVKNRANLTRIICIILIILLMGYLCFYIYYGIIKRQGPNGTNCKNLELIYKSQPTLTSIVNSAQSPYGLRDFYIKTAYNCCCPGQFKNDFVDICALTTCIKQGARCLDFEIYSINDEPVVAASSVDSFTIKETYNYLPISEVFNTITKTAFSSGTCPNSDDPLILHFRFMSKNIPMYKNLYTELKNMRHYLLGTNYSYEYRDASGNAQNLGAVPISTFKQKIIIIADARNPVYQRTHVDEYINLASGTPFMQIMNYETLKYTQDLTLKDFNKKNMSIVLPNWRANDTNPNFNIARTYGCQFIGMSFQNYDSNLELYDVFFDKNKTAFVLKPPDLRYIPVTIPVPPPAPAEYSYANRSIKSDYYHYNI